MDLPTRCHLPATHLGLVFVHSVRIKSGHECGVGLAVMLDVCRGVQVGSSLSQGARYSELRRMRERASQAGGTSDVFNGLCLIASDCLGEKAARGAPGAAACLPPGNVCLRLRDYESDNNYNDISQQPTRVSDQT